MSGFEDLNGARRGLLLGGLAFALRPAMARASDAGERPVRLVVGFAAGGPTDILARIVAPALSHELGGQPVIVENRAGASGTIAAQSVARAQPDGSTLLLATDVDMAIVPNLNPALPYDPGRELRPVIGVAEQCSVMVVRTGSGIDSVSTFVARAKASPGRLSYASAGKGSPSHMVGALFEIAAGVSLNHVPYKGAGPASADLLGGHVDAMFIGGPAALGHVRSGAMKALAVTGKARTAQLPDVPTFAEAGLDRPGLDTGTWFAIVSPAATPTPAVERIARAWKSAVSRPETVARLEQLSLVVRSDDAAAVSGWIARDLARWAGVIRTAGIRPD